MKRLLYILIFTIISTSLQSQTNFRILSYNTYLLPRLFGNTVIKRSALIAEYLYNSNSDIITLQEVFDKKALRIILNKLSIKYPYYIKPIKKDSNLFKISNGLLILSRYPILSYDSYRYKNICGSDAFAEKGIIKINVRINNLIISIYDTHLNSGYDTKFNKIREKEYDEIKNFIKNDSDINILCGDFNTYKSDTIAYKYMIDNLDLKDYDFNHNTYSKNENSLAKDNENDIIDYIFTQKNNDKMILTHSIDKPKEIFNNKLNDLSDHFPVICGIKIL